MDVIYSRVAKFEQTDRQAAMIEAEGGAVFLPPSMLFMRES